jgi:hypothetical protein
MVFTTYKILNSIEDPGLRAKVEADLSGHPQNERSGPLAFFYLMQNVCNLEHDQETEVCQALYKVRHLAHSRLMTQPGTRSIASHQDQAKVALARDTFIPIGVTTASAGAAI